MKKIVKIAFAATILILIFLWITGPETVEADGAGDLYYYSCGGRIALRLSTEAIALKFRSPVSLDRRRGLLRSVAKIGDGASESLRPIPRRVDRVKLKRGVTAEEYVIAIRQLNSKPEVEYAASLLVPGGCRHPIALTNEFIAKFKPEIDTSGIEAMNSAHGAEIVRKDPHFPNQYLLKINTATGLESLHAANAYCESEAVEWSHPNFIPHIELSFLPDDTLFDEQWHLRNTGQEDGTPGADIDAAGAWDVTTGSSDIVIAVYDNGFDIDHEDLSENIAPGGKNFGSGDPDDVRPRTADENHGTACAGLAAAVGNNSLGVAGIAYGCRILPLKFDIDTTTSQDNADAITYAAENADVMSNSWSAYAPADVVVEALEAAASSGRNGKGLPIFFAAANDNENIDKINTSPICNLPSVIAVGAIYSDGTRALYSNYGTSLAILAPGGTPYSEYLGGHGVTTTDRTAPDGYNPNGNYCRAGGESAFSGTSAACALAAGVAALILSNNPDLSQWQVETILKQTAGDLGDPGFDIYNGWGLVNAGAAVNAPVPDSPIVEPVFPLRIYPEENYLYDEEGSVSLMALVPGPIRTPFYPFLRIVNPDSSVMYVTSTDEIVGRPAPYFPAPITIEGKIERYTVTTLDWDRIALGEYWIESGAVDAAQTTSADNITYIDRVYSEKVTVGGRW